MVLSLEFTGLRAKILEILKILKSRLACVVNTLFCGFLGGVAARTKATYLEQTSWLKRHHGIAYVPICSWNREDLGCSYDGFSLAIDSVTLSARDSATMAGGNVACLPASMNIARGRRFPVRVLTSVVKANV